MYFLSAMIKAKSIGDNSFHLVYNGDGPEDNFLTQNIMTKQDLLYSDY